MIHYFLIIVLLFGGSFLGASTPSSSTQNFLVSLSEEERSNLDAFIQILLEHSGVGYVLLEEKPMTFLPFGQSYQIFPYIPPGNAIRMCKGLPVFQKMMGQLPIKKYSMSLVPFDSENAFFQFIHKKRLKEVIEENETLFQYGLGCFADTSYLMNEFLKGERHLYSILNEDVTLVGIVLGFGAKNAMMCSRYEKLLNYSISSLNPPYRMHEDCKPIQRSFRYANFNEPSTQKTKLQPSIGFNSIEEELLSNETQGRSCSSYNLFNYLPKLVFGHYGDQAFDEQIKRYEETQLKLIKLLDSESLTEDFLTLLVSDEIEGGSQINAQLLEATPSSSLPKLQNESEINEIISLALLDIYDFFFPGELKERYFSDYIKGMLEVEQSEELKNEYLCLDSVSKLYAERYAKDVLERKDKADSFFSRLAQDVRFQPVIPQKVYYQILQEGSDDSVKIDQNHRLLNGRYAVYSEAGVFLVGTDIKSVELDLSEMLPAFAQALLGAKIGERREIYIHPSFGYGLWTNDQTGAYLRFEVSIDSIKEKPFEKMVVVESVEAREGFQTEPFSFEKFDQMHRQFARKLGQLNWQFFREVSSEQLVHQLKEKKDEPIIFSDVQKEALLDICGQIYQKKESREISFALDFFKKLYPADGCVKEVVKERLYYRSIEKGKGPLVDKKDLVSLVYKVKNCAGSVLNRSAENVVCLDMQRAMKPLREGLLGLPRGERGILYVHPDWCGLDLSIYPSNVFITIEFELKI